MKVKFQVDTCWNMFEVGFGFVRPFVTKSYDSVLVVDCEIYILLGFWTITLVIR